MKFAIIIAVLMLVGFGCLFKRGKVNDVSDFRFTLIDETFSYDSQSELYTRVYGSGDSSLALSLTDKELKSIAEYSRQIDFQEFPKEFECAPNSDRTVPAFTTTIKISYGQNHNEVTNSDFCSKKVNQKGSDQFYKLAAKIVKILNSKEQVKNMKDSDLIFM